MIAEAEQVADDMFRYPFQLAFSAAFGERGYGLPVGGLPHTLPTISRGRCARPGIGRALLGVRPVVIAVGDVDPDAASDAAGRRYSDAPAARAGGASSRRSIGWPARRRAGDAAW